MYKIISLNENFSLVSIFRVVSSPKPLMLCLVGISSRVGRTDTIFTETSPTSGVLISLIFLFSYHTTLGLRLESLIQVHGNRNVHLICEAIGGEPLQQRRQAPYPHPTPRKPIRQRAHRLRGHLATFRPRARSPSTPPYFYCALHTPSHHLTRSPPSCRPTSVLPM